MISRPQPFYRHLLLSRRIAPPTLPKRTLSTTISKPKESHNRVYKKIPHSRTMTTSTTHQSQAQPEQDTNSLSNYSNTKPKQATPIEDSIKSKLNTSLDPLHILKIQNDSQSHAHHSSMKSHIDQPNIARETHFRLYIVSDAFKGMAQAKRHRMVYKVLAEELKSVEEGGGGVHALSLRTRTREEEEEGTGG